MKGMLNFFYTLVGLTLCLTMFACGANAPVPEASEQDIASILSMDTPEGDYGEKRKCLSVHSYDGVEMLDRRHLLFEGRGDKVWLNRLRSSCAGLRRSDILRFDIRSGRLCSLDLVSGVSRALFGLTRATASCSLGEFEAITKEQAELLRELVHE